MGEYDEGEEDEEGDEDEDSDENDHNVFYKASELIVSSWSIKKQSGLLHFFPSFLL